MILRQRSTFLDPFLLKFVCHHFDSRLLRWALKLFGLWNQEIRPSDRAAMPETAPNASFPIHLEHYVSPIIVNKVGGTRDLARRHR